MAESRLEQVRRHLADARGHRVIAVSHCLLDENVRYQGGAGRPGALTELLQAVQAADLGVYQMPCPEQRAWGGVARPPTLAAYGASGTARFRARRPLLWMFRLRCRVIYRRLARSVARDLADLAAAGVDVRAVLGVGASPTCGVCHTVDLGRAVEAMGACRLATMTPTRFADEVLLPAAVRGQGLFIRALTRQLHRRQLHPAMLEHDLLAEIHGQPVTFVVPP